MIIEETAFHLHPLFQIIASFLSSIVTGESLLRGRMHNIKFKSTFINTKIALSVDIHRTIDAVMWFQLHC